jgi:hypothetical protein
MEEMWAQDEATVRSVVEGLNRRTALRPQRATSRTSVCCTG